MVLKEGQVEVGQLFRLRRGINPITREWLIRNVGFRTPSGEEFLYASAIVKRRSGDCVSSGGSVLPRHIEKFYSRVLTVDEFKQLAMRSIQEGILSFQDAESFVQDFIQSQQTERTRSIQWQE